VGHVPIPMLCRTRSQRRAREWGAGAERSPARPRPSSRGERLTGQTKACDRGMCRNDNENAIRIKRRRTGRSSQPLTLQAMLARQPLRPLKCGVQGWRNSLLSGLFCSGSSSRIASPRPLAQARHSRYGAGGTATYRGNLLAQTPVWGTCPGHGGRLPYFTRAGPFPARALGPDAP